MNIPLLLEQIRYRFVGHHGIKQRMVECRGGTLDKMVEINQKSKLFYTVVPKAANSSIKRLLWADLGVVLSAEETMRTVHKRKKPQPTTPPSQLTDTRLQEILADETWLKFSFVRNPYTRLYSAFQDKILDPSRNRNFLTRMEWDGKELPDFRQFVEKIVAQPVERMDWYWRPQESLLMREIIPYQFIGRMEHFRTDLSPVLARLSLDDKLLDELLGVKTNATGNSARKEKKLPFTSEVAELIYRKYEQDFLLFGYEKDSWQG